MVNEISVLGQPNTPCVDLPAIVGMWNHAKNVLHWNKSCKKNEFHCFYSHFSIHINPTTSNDIPSFISLLRILHFCSMLWLKFLKIERRLVDNAAAREHRMHLNILSICIYGGKSYDLIFCTASVSMHKVHACIWKHEFYGKRVANCKNSAFPLLLLETDRWRIWDVSISNRNIVVKRHCLPAEWK